MSHIEDTRPSALEDTDPEPTGDSPVVEVRSLFRGITVGSCLLPDLADRALMGRHAGGIRRMVAGATLVVAALVLFISTAMNVGTERREWGVRQPSDAPAAALDAKPGSLVLDLLFFVALVGGGSLMAAGLGRRGKRRSGFFIGAGPGVDAVADPTYIEGAPGAVHALVAVSDGRYVVNTTPRMTGEIRCENGDSYDLAELARGQGARFPLPDWASVRVDCGQATFVVASTLAPRRLPAPLFFLRWQDQRHTAGVAAAFALFMLMIFSVPPDASALSTRALHDQRHYLPFTVVPAAPDAVPLTAGPTGSAAAPAAGRGSSRTVAEGQVGSRTAPKRLTKLAVMGAREAPSAHPTRRMAADAAAQTGILGILRAEQAGPLASIFARSSAFGTDATGLIAGLIGTTIGEAYGVGGISVRGTGQRGGGTGDRPLGTGTINTVGTRDGQSGDGGPGYGRNNGGLPGRGPRTPNLLVGHLEVRGSLDKEIVRRTVRRHLNEIRYCYEQELVRHRDLAGRVVVQFTISASGQVLSSVLQSSTIGNARVEGCAVQAARRWTFPQPAGGSLVIVSYPFVLTPAGAGV